MENKKVTLTRYSVIVNGSDAKKAIKPMRYLSNETMFLDVFEDNMTIICCVSFRDVRNCLDILKDAGCYSAMVNLERVYNECNYRLINSAYCILNTVDVKGGYKMNNHMNDIEPCVKESFESAVKALKEKLGEAVANIADTKINEALVDYKMAAYMYGYFTAMAEAFHDCSKVFYTAATNMIHFKYYNYNEEAYDYD